MLAVLTTSGCGLLLDLDPRDTQGVDGGEKDAFDTDLARSDGGVLDASPTDGSIEDAGNTDGALPDPCASAPIGTFCDEIMTSGPALICRGEECVASVCGDGIIDGRSEECDDANDVGNDGCEPVTCDFTCAHDMDCPAAPSACLAPSCSAGGCSYVPAGDGEACIDGSSSAGSCAGGACRRAGCGDGRNDTGEDCDDANAIDGDGCDADCTFSCDTDSDCSDGDPCNGNEMCSGSHVCVAGEPLDCGAASDACHVRGCVPFDTCRTALKDMDGDGFASTMHGSCGRDCDDGNPLVNPGSTEICSNGVDDNCNSAIDEGAAVANWYADRDRDGYGDPLTVVRSCEPVPGHVRRAGDCFDAFTLIASVVNPSQTGWFTSAYIDDTGASSFDYDCSGSAEKRFSEAASTCRFISVVCGGDGWQDGDPACGVSDDWQTCRGIVLVCAAVREMRTQACR